MTRWRRRTGTFGTLARWPTPWDGWIRRPARSRNFRCRRRCPARNGLVDDKDGHIWFTANFAGYIGELDAKTGAVKEYPLPDPAARDPHTLLFDNDGILWFTVQNANMIGRLDPRSGDIKLVRMIMRGAASAGLIRRPAR
jgi:streptogramin lyase